MRKGGKGATYRVTLSGLLLAIMLVLGFVESMLPAGPVPGMKLGLSNSVLIFAVYMLDLPTAWMLMAMKVVLSGLMFSGVSAMMYAFAGGVLSLGAMSLLSRFRSVPVPVTSMAGGVMHNVGQTLLAMVILHMGRQMLYYLGILLLVGLGTGALTGVAAAQAMRHLRSAGWGSARENKGKTWLLVLLAVLVVAAAGFYAWTQLPHVTGVVVTTSAPVTMTPADQLPPGLEGLMPAG